MVYRRSTRATQRAQLNRPWFPPPEALHGPGIARMASGADLLIVHTLVIAGPPGTGISHWEIHFAPDAAAPRLIILTRNEALYTRALAAEGSPARFDLTYHPSKRPDGSYCSLLDTLEERTR
jgi:hypothetical protein